MRDVLVLVRECRSWQYHVRYAASLSATLHATLTGIYVATSSIPIPDVASPRLTAEIIEIYRDECEQAKRAEAPFTRWAADHGVPRSAWRLADGPVSLALESEAIWYDALVIERDPGASSENAGAVGQLLVRVDLPFFVVPAGVDSARLDTIAIAWNGSAESARALHSALPLLRHASRIVLLSGERHAPFSAPRRNSEIDIARYLEWQRLRVERVNIEADGDYAGVAILEEAQRASADLLVLGAYGRTRFSEWFLGGVTRHMLEHATLPLLMRH
jgi:nucleotide-binding universal stress UspA family protein